MTCRMKDTFLSQKEENMYLTKDIFGCLDMRIPRALKSNLDLPLSILI